MYFIPLQVAISFIFTSAIFIFTLIFVLFHLCLTDKKSTSQDTKDVVFDDG